MPSLHPEVAYILDCAMELGETTALENTVLRHHPKAYAQVDQLILDNQAMPEHFLQNTARNELNQLPREQQYYFALASLVALPFALQTMQERAVHVMQQRLQGDLEVGPAPLYKLYPELVLARQPLIQKESDITEGLVRQLLEDMFGPTAARMREDLALVQEALAWYEQVGELAFRHMVYHGSFKPTRLPGANGAYLAQKALEVRRQKKQERTLVAQAKAAIKKATKLFQNLGQEDNLRMFVSGGEVVLQHPESRFKLVLKPLDVSGWLIDRTQHGRSHTPYELSLFTKDDVYLAKLCVYFKDTPVLDQLLALTFYVQAGNEVDILEKANWYALSNWSDEKSALVLQAYPQLASRLPRKDESPRRGIRVNREFEDAQNHWRPFAGRVGQWTATWFEPVVQLSLGMERFIPQLERILRSEREPTLPLTYPVLSPHQEPCNRTVDLVPQAA